jgi:nitrogen fixation/metabolism regulation signal transduction histidine kinase
MAVFQGKRLRDVSGLQDFARVVQEQFEIFSAMLRRAGRDRWQQVYELDAGNGDVVHNTTSLVMRGAELPDDQRLLVFDDISEIVSAQRAQAWGEVARRVAHEIKNPLTPIQLSAERMAMKLTDKLEPAEQALLTKSVKTIVDQVAAMKRLVDEFRDARLPAANLQPWISMRWSQRCCSSIRRRMQPCAWRHRSTKRCPLIQAIASNCARSSTIFAKCARCDGSESAGNRADSGSVTIETRWNDAAQRVRLSISDSGTGLLPIFCKELSSPM